VGVERDGEPAAVLQQILYDHERNVRKARGPAKEGNARIVIYNVTSQNTRGNYKREPYVLVLTPLGHVSKWGGEGRCCSSRRLLYMIFLG